MKLEHDLLSGDNVDLKTKLGLTDIANGCILEKESEQLSTQ